MTLALLLVQPQASFTRFTYCRDNARGVYESQCIYLNPDGSGEIRFTRRGADEVRAPLALSQPGSERLLAVLAGTNFLADAKNYESKKKVADLGQKHLILELPSGTREARFNYSEIREVNALVLFFDGMLNQEAIVSEIETAIRFERLSIPQRLDQLENELRANRIGDPRALVVLLDKIEKDDRLVNYARTHARKLKEQLAAGK